MNPYLGLGCLHLIIDQYSSIVRPTVELGWCVMTHDAERELERARVGGGKYCGERRVVVCTFTRGVK